MKNKNIRSGDAVPPICYNCKRKIVGTFQTCTAFPGGIPAKIIGNIADHREPFEGDRGLRFDPIDPSEPMPDFGPQVKDN